MIEALANREVVHLPLVAELLAAEAPALRERVSLSDLTTLMRRLPTGLVHAEAVWILSSRPSDLVPLGPGSAWSAMDRSLVVEAPHALPVLLDLARYRLAAEVVRRRFADRDDLIEALMGGDAPSLSTELAVLLEADPAEVAELGPALRSDLAFMAQIDFAPPIHLHDAVRPDRQRERGVAFAETILGALPEGPFHLILSDGPGPIEMLSPYVRDLSEALFQWGVENPGAIHVHGLVDALQSYTPAPDLASLILPDLFAHAPELLPERRENERSQGLFLEDHRDAIVGFADLNRLAAPDRLAVPEEADGPLVLLVTEVPGLMTAFAARLLQTGRVRGQANVLSAPVRADVLVPRSLATAEDGFALGGAQRLMDKADEIGMLIQRAERLEDPPAVLADLLRGFRRARVLGWLRDRCPIYSVLHAAIPDGAHPTMQGASAGLLAARLALLALLTPIESERGVIVKAPKSKGKPSFPRRFRA